MNKSVGRSRGKQGKRRIAASAYVTLRKGQRYVPPVVRALLGLCLMVMGVFGFLPILGFWMIPLGLALLASDIPPLSRWLRNRLRRAMLESR